MKFNPTPKEARSLSQDQEARDLRRMICKEINTMDAKELQKLLWKIQKGKR